MNELENKVVDYRLKLNLICAIKNSISLICFTILAIVFDKWWLVLLSGLFLSSISKDEEN